MAAALAIRRRRLFTVGVLDAVLLGALWLANARSVAKAVGHCLAVESTVLDDDECFVYLKWPLPVAIASLMLIVAVCRGEAVTRAQAAGGAQGDRHRPDGKLADASAFFALYFLCAMIFLAGKMIQRDGALLVSTDPADKMGAYLLKLGPIYYDAGFLALSVVNCCFTVPYILGQIDMVSVRQVCELTVRLKRDHLRVCR